MKFEYLDQPAASPRAPIKFQYLDSAPAPSPVHVAAPKVPSSPWYMEPLGPLEAAANLGVGTAASVAGGLGALADAPLYAAGITRTSPADVVHAAESFAEKPIFQPETATGKALLTAASWPFKKLAQGARAAGNYVLDKTGSPAAAAAVDTAIQAAPMIAGVKFPESSLVKGTKDSIRAAKEKSARNAVKDDAIRTARGAGYRLHPQEVSSGFGSRALQMFAGEAKLGRQISHKNMGIADIAAREELGMPQNSVLDVDTLRDYRHAQSGAFAPVSSIGMLASDSQYGAALRSLVKEYVDAGRSFPETHSPVRDMVRNLSQPIMRSDAAVAKARMLRRDAADSFRKGDSSLGSAQRKAADALEELLIRAAKRRGMDPKIIENMRVARANIAKSYAIENALHNGHVDVRKLARQWKEGRGTPFTGRLLEMAKVGSAFPKSTQMTEAPPLGVIEGGGMMMGPALHLAGLGLPPSLALLGLGAARPFTRFLMASEPYQRMAIKPGRYPVAPVNPSFARFLATYMPAATASAQQEQ